MDRVLMGLALAVALYGCTGGFVSPTSQSTDPTATFEGEAPDVDTGWPDITRPIDEPDTGDTGLDDTDTDDSGLDDTDTDDSGLMDTDDSGLMDTDDSGLMDTDDSGL